MNVTVNNGIIRIELPFAELCSIATKEVVKHVVKTASKPAMRIGRAGVRAPVQRAILDALKGGKWKRAGQLRREAHASEPSFQTARNALEQAGKIERRGEAAKTEYRLTLSSRISTMKKETAKLGKQLDKVTRRGGRG